MLDEVPAVDECEGDDLAVDAFRLLAQDAVDRLLIGLQRSIGVACDGPRRRARESRPDAGLDSLMEVDVADNLMRPFELDRLVSGRRVRFGFMNSFEVDILLIHSLGHFESPEVLAVKRDMELIRKILFAAEAAPVGVVLKSEDVAAKVGSTADVVSEHIVLLSDVNWADIIGPGWSLGGNRMGAAALLRLTNQGHDALSAFRQDTVWKKVLNAVSPVGSVPLDLAKTIALEALRDALGISEE